MALRQFTLTLTPTEEAALARLIAFLCGGEDVEGHLSRILGKSQRDVEAIGRINAALNANR